MKYRVSHITLLLILCSTLPSIADTLDVGDPRTVRLIYFLPNDRPYRADVEKQMKTEIRTVQTFYATAMDAHGFGKKTFRIETDQKDAPIVHRVDGQHPFSHYDHTLGTAVIDELAETFDFTANIYFVVLGTDAVQSGPLPVAGVGGRKTKNGGWLLVPNNFSWETVAHELGHAFGLDHDYRDGAYIMSYSSDQDQLSACAAYFLSVHPYFNPDTPTDTTAGQLPTIELLSPRSYPTGSTSVPVRVKVSDSDGLHQVILHAVGSVQECRRLTGETSAVVEFDYDGGFGLEGFISLSHARTGGMLISCVDTLGNLETLLFKLTESSPYHITDLSGHGENVLSVSFSPDGRLLAVGAENGIVTLWNVATHEKFATLPKAENAIEAVAFSPNGRLLAVETIKQITLLTVATQQPVAHLRHPIEFTSMAFSSDGKRIAAGMGDGTVTLWDVATHRNIATLTHGNYVTSVAFSRQGIMASASDDKTVTLWDVATQKKRTTLTHEDTVLFVAFSPDGGTLAYGGWGDRYPIQLFDVIRQQPIAPIPHGSLVYGFAFSPDGQSIASGGWDGTVKLWDVSTQVQYATFPSAGPLYSVAFSPSGNTLASGGTGTGIVELWDASAVIPLRVEVLTPVNIPDKNLRTAIAKALGVAADAKISKGEMKALTQLDAPDANISELTGLESATQLTSLNLDGNAISDLSALSTLTNLTYLGLSGNSITDISALSTLTNLTTLWLGGNTITDISALSTLTNLQELTLEYNTIEDISALGTLTKLRNLELGGNTISDLTPLAGLTELTGLWLSQNTISDLTPLAELTKLTELWLLSNPLNTMALTTHIPALQSREVKVYFDAPQADVNADGIVNILDLVRVASAFGQDAGANPAMDVNSDGEINILDLVRVANFFAKAQ